MSKSVIAGLAFFLCFGHIQAQEIDPIKLGVLRLLCPDGATGTAFVVDQRDEGTKVFATAWHVVQYRVNGKDVAGDVMFPGTDPYVVETEKGELLGKARIAIVDSKNDIALLTCKIDKTFESPKLHESFTCPDVSVAYAGKGSPVEFMGYANRSFFRTEGNLGLREGLTIFSDAVLIPGMSGGPMLMDGKVVGIVSGGMKWFKDGEVNVTWPARCGSVVRIVELLKLVK